MSVSKKQIELFQYLFKGREDVYARRWEKENRSGYMPAYDVDWDLYEKQKRLEENFRISSINVGISDAASHKKSSLGKRDGGNLPASEE